MPVGPTHRCKNLRTTWEPVSVAGRGGEGRGGEGRGGEGRGGEGRGGEGRGGEEGRGPTFFLAGSSTPKPATFQAPPSELRVYADIQSDLEVQLLRLKHRLICQSRLLLP